MRTLPIMLTLGLGLGLGLALATPAGADGGFSLRIGAGVGNVASDPDPDAMAPERGAPHHGTGREFRRGETDEPPHSRLIKRKRRVDARDDPRDRFHRPRRRPFFLVPRFDDDDDDEERIVVVPVPTPAPDPPEAKTAEPPPPPDPRGPAIRPARGVGTAAPFTVGEPLPADLPHVALDWRSYALPEPPPGLAYARVGRAVLLIDPATRVVARVVEPDELGPGEG